ncbi:GNAT family N-acetyltransferase [uncultured Cohaesibacter sp.]|uniref:GNAT family N-acetyltransferase n=1 Tax=uncultured Cohaesibacter sp. TaxID=1002546 RepID=UPI0029C668E4|nr:GNAT family N-acetyltransferase [uncultured Cohaesibacter sp.]
MSDLVIRPASLEEFAIAVEWAAGEGWNPGLDDLAVFHGADPDGFIMGFLDGEPVSSISVVRYSDDFGFLGFYIVHPDHRGSGVGMATWTAGMAHLEGCTVGLDGVVAQQENYQRSGYTLAGRNVRYCGTISTPPAEKTVIDVSELGEQDASDMLALDRECFGLDREPFIRPWTLPQHGVRRTSLAAKVDGRFVGFGTIRTCREGYKIGPLFCQGPSAAEALFSALVATVPAESMIILDVPEGNRDAVALAEGAGLEPVFETARMYRGEDPGLPLQHIFGITTFELG